MTERPRRSVQEHVIVSPAMPPVRIQIDPMFTSVGGPSFVLYGVAHAEQHLFVIANDQRVVQRLIWVQFEGYLPSNQHTYNYRQAEMVMLGPYAFRQDVHRRNITAAVQERADSDLAHAHAYLQARGYGLGDEAAFVRFVHLIGDPARDELMIIYLEDLRQHGLRLDDLAPEGEAAAQWPSLAEALVARARASFAVLPQ